MSAFVGSLDIVDYGLVAAVNRRDLTIGDTMASGVDGSVIFVGSGLVAQDNSNFFWDSSAKKLGIQTATPRAGVHVGNDGSTRSSDPSFLAARDLTSGSGSAHGFADNCYFNRSAEGYCSFDARVDITGANNIDHYIAFQAYPRFLGAGNSTNHGGFVSAPAANVGGIVNNSTHFFAADTGGTVSGIQYGYFCDPLTAGAANWAFYALGITPSYFGGNVTFAQMTVGSVLFAGGGGLMSQDNSKLYYDASNHRLLLGSNTAVSGSIFQIINSGGTVSASMSSFGGQCVLSTTQAQGTQGSPTATTTAANLFTLDAEGYDGSAYGTGGNAVFYPTATWNVGSHPAAYRINLCASGSTTQTAALDIQPDKSVQFFGSVTTNGNAITAVGGSLTALTTFALRDTSAAFDVTHACTSSTALTAGRTFTLDVVNGSRTLKLGANVTINAALTVSSNTANRITIFDSSNNLTTDANLTWDASTFGIQPATATLTLCSSGVNQTTLNIGTHGSVRQSWRCDTSANTQFHDEINNRDLLALNTGGNASVLAGLSSGQARLGGTIFDHSSDAASTHTNGTEDDLYSDSVAASVLGTNNDKVEARYSVVTVAHATATRQIRVYFAGTLIFDSGPLATVTGDSPEIHVLIIRKSSTIVRCTVKISSLRMGGYPTFTEVTGLTLSGANILKITGTAAGTGAAASDIVAKLGTVEWKGAA